jgi:tape measure domain-containing protein
MPAGKSYPLSLILTAVDRVTAPLNRITASLNRATAPVRSVQQSFGAFKTAAGVDKLHDAMGDVTRSITGIGSAASASFGKVTVLIGAATAGAYLFKRQFIDTAAEFESMRLRLAAVTGDEAQGKEALAFITNLSMKSPFAIEAITDAFVKLRMNGLDPSAGSLQAIVDQVAKVGGNTEQMQGIATALTQILGKGRVSAEEMNQLGERGINGWELLARAIKRTQKQTFNTAQLRKMAEEGQLGRKSVLLMIEQMGKESAGSAATMSKSWSGMVQGLLTRWQLFTDKVMNSGPFDVLKKRLAGVLERVDQMAKSGELDKIAERWGARLVALFTWIEERGVPMAVSAFQTISSWLQKAADVAGGWENLLKFGLALFVAAPIIAAIGGVVAALGSLALAVGATPVGWFLVALIVLVTELALWAVALMSQWKKITAFYSALWSAVTDIFRGFSEFLQGVFTLDVQRAIDGLKQYFKGLFDFVAQGFSVLKNVLGFVGNSFGVGAAAGQLIPSGAPLGADRAAAAINPPHELHANVNFSNMPPGTRVSTRISDRMTLDLTRGYSMVDAR